jgi:rubrerythrin
MDTIIKWANLSDNQRWKIEGNYDYPWISELSDDDKAVLKTLRDIAKGEHSGTGSVYMMFKMIPEDYINDWATIAVYSSIISYEEFRHGTVINALNGIKLSDEEWAEDTRVEADNVHNWTAYSLLMSFAISEATNVMVYEKIINAVEDERLKDIFKNIKRDEARHLSAWRDLIKQLINKNDFHKQQMLDNLDLAIHFHNAEIHKDYMRGADMTKHLWTPKDLMNVTNTKFKLLEHWFGDDNPYTPAKLKIAHVKAMRK